MGLDIEVLKPIKATEALIKADLEDNLPGAFSSISLTENTCLEIFKQFSFKKECEYIDWDKTLSKLGLNIDLDNDYVWTRSDIIGHHFILKDFHDKKVPSDEKSEIIFIYEDLVPSIVTEDYIICESIAWQRKGANALFYKADADGNSMWDSPPVVEKNVLLEHWDKYFSKNVNDEGGFGFEVEFEQSNSEMRKNFKNNIIKHFVQGENFVIYR